MSINDIDLIREFAAAMVASGNKPSRLIVGEARWQRMCKELSFDRTRYDQALEPTPQSMMGLLVHMHDDPEHLEIA